ncbi:MAG: alpha/beta hydrolase [Clostridiales bacterium]|nr:alpha/beta hydrolase [Clostridiales bacterium]
MKSFRENIWNEGEYNYEAAYGFVPNIVLYIHDGDAAPDGADKPGSGCEDSSVSDAKCTSARPFMLVVPGGGYCMCVPPEGEVVAKEFYDRGMNCAVLTYTTDITMSVPLLHQPENDISRAVRYIRKNAARFGADSGKIVICGFSAGAHVCGTLGVHYKDIKDSDEKFDAVSNRPDAMILSYPVITSGEFTHIYSMWALIGEHGPKEEYEYFSLEKHVTSDTPPTFLWQTVTDDLVPVENSMMFAEACRKASVPYTYHAFPQGFHGLSVFNKAWKNGDFGEPYTMEQVDRAVAAVKEGRGVRVSEKRVAELRAQFPDPSDAPQDPPALPDLPYIPGVALWPELAGEWMKNLWEAG